MFRRPGGNSAARLYARAQKNPARAKGGIAVAGPLESTSADEGQSTGRTIAKSGPSGQWQSCNAGGAWMEARVTGYSRGSAKSYGVLVSRVARDTSAAGKMNRCTISKGWNVRLSSVELVPDRNGSRSLRYDVP